MVSRSAGTYGRFARYYDFIYEGLVDYDGDVDYLEAVFRRFAVGRVRTVLDLGCGTGNHALRLARRGYEVTGLDLSRDQLAVARGKARDAQACVRFVRGDMRSFRLHQTFDAAVCMFGAFGYLLPPKDVVSSLRSTGRHLRSGGLFLFEFWQSSAAHPAPYRSWFHKVGPAYELVRLSESRYDSRTRLLPIEFRFFVFRAGRVLDRFDETHTVRTYRVERMRQLLRRGGFDLLAAHTATPTRKGFAPARRDTFRIMAVARLREAKRSRGQS